jgi:hypothetical protein
VTFRFIHSSDLDIGRKFANIPEPPDGNIRGRLMEARHAAIGKLAQAARYRGAAHILLAGDTFDTATPSPVLIRQALSAMGEAPEGEYWESVAMAVRKFEGGIEAEDFEQGLLIRQGGSSYIARNWRLSSATEELIETAIEAGLGCMIRNDHPRVNARWPNTRGVVYLAFSPDAQKQWSVAIDTYKLQQNDYSHAVFNGKYLAQFKRTGVPFRFEGRNKSAGHLVVQRQCVIPAIKMLANFDHSVLELNRNKAGGGGFTTEYVLQQQMLVQWKQTPWAERYDIVQDEFPVDGGLTSRRIDILAKDRQTGDWLIIELKKAEASVEAVHQVVSYQLALGKRDDFAFGRLDGVLVAERVPMAVRKMARNEGIAVFEAQWPLKFDQVA